jgi:hypothetical protein
VLANPAELERERFALPAQPRTAAEAGRELAQLYARLATRRP